MQLFHADSRVFFKTKLKLFFAHENIKNWPQKLYTYGSLDFFLSAAPAENGPYWKCVSRHVHLNLWKQV